MDLQPVVHRDSGRPRPRPLVRWIRLAALLGMLGVLAVGTPPVQARVIGKTAEISVGRETASQVEKFFKVDTDPVAVARVRSLGRRLAACATDADYPFEFHVVESGEINAFALPGGFIYVFRGLLQLVPNDDALAFVLAHEISHVTRRHAVRQFEKNVLLAAGLTAILSGTGASSGFRDAASVVQTISGLSFTRSDEADADETGMALFVKAGFNPRAAPEAMEIVKRAAGSDNSTPNLLRSHPAPDSRIKKLTRLAEDAVQKRKTMPPPAVVAPPPPPQAQPLPGIAEIEPAPCAWMPLAVGARWTYRTTGSGAEGVAQVRTLEALASSPGAFRVEYDFGRSIRTVRVVVPAGDRYLSRPEKGASAAAWKLEAVFDAPAGEVRGEYRSGGSEKLKVPAGEFDTVRIERLGADGKVESTSWYARGVGLVKSLSAVTGITQELKSYSVPKPEPAPPAKP